MMNTDHLCMSCMREIGDENQCPYCGFHADSPQLAPYLPLRTVVAERYLAGKLLDYNGDGATYLGSGDECAGYHTGISAGFHC